MDGRGGNRSRGVRPGDLLRARSPASPPATRTPSACGSYRPCATSSGATPSSPPVASRAARRSRRNDALRSTDASPADVWRGARREPSARSSRDCRRRRRWRWSSSEPPATSPPARSCPPWPTWPTGACSTTGSPSSAWPAPSGTTRSSGPMWPRPRPRAARSGGRSPSASSTSAGSTTTRTRSAS